MKKINKNKNKVNANINNENKKNRTNISKKKISKKSNFLIFFIKYIITAIISIFLLFFLSISLLITILSILSIKVENKHFKDISKRIILSKYSNTDLDYSGVIFKKTDLKQMKIVVQINDLILKYKKENITIGKIKELRLTFPISKIITGNFVPSISKIENNEFNIFLSQKTSLELKNKIEKNNKKELNEIFEEFLSIMFSKLKNTEFLLKNGVEFSNITINFIEKPNFDRKIQLKIKKSETKILSKNETENKEIKDFLKKVDNKNNKFNEDNFFEKVLNKANNFISKEISNDRNNILIHNTTMQIGDENFSIKGLCNEGKIGKAKCALSVNNFPIFSIFVSKDYDFLKKKNIKLNSDIFIDINKNNIKNFELIGNVEINDILKFKDFSFYVKKININLTFLDNLKKINLIKLELFDKNDNKFITFNIKNVKLTNNKIKNGEIEMRINSANLLDIFDISLEKNQFNSDNVKFNDDNQKNVDENLSSLRKTLINCNVDGLLSFKFNNNGQLIPVKKNSQIRIKNLHIGYLEGMVDTDNLLFNLNIEKNKIILTTLEKDKSNSSLIITYNTEGKFIEIVFNNLFLNENKFNEAKNKLLNNESKNYIKNFLFSTKINGNIKYFFDKNIRRYSILSPKKQDKIDLELNLISKDLEDNKDDIVDVFVQKKENEENGDIKIDLKNSNIESGLFDFIKKDNDKALINLKFVPKNELLNMYGDVLFNNDVVGKIKFNHNFQKNISSYEIITKNFNLNVFNDNEKEITINIAGDKFIIGKQLWRLFLSYCFSYQSNKDILLKAIFNVKESRISNVLFKNTKADIKMTGNYFFTGEFETELSYFNRNFESAVFKNENNKFLVNGNILPILLLLEVDGNEYKEINLKGNGEFDDNLQNTIGEINIEVKYLEDKTFAFDRVDNLNSKNFIWNNKQCVIKNSHINGKWFDIFGDIEIMENNYNLKGRFRSLTPAKKIKHLFFRKKNLTKNDGVEITKNGKNIEEFNKNLIINKIDFSTDEDGVSKHSIFWDLND